MASRPLASRRHSLRCKTGGKAASSAGCEDGTELWPCQLHFMEASDGSVMARRESASREPRALRVRRLQCATVCPLIGSKRATLFTAGERVPRRCIKKLAFSTRVQRWLRFPRRQSARALQPKTVINAKPSAELWHGCAVEGASVAELGKVGGSTIRVPGVSAVRVSIQVCVSAVLGPAK